MSDLAHKTIRQLIDNRDKIGDYQVRVYANENAVNRFQCATIEYASEAAVIISEERREKGLPTSRATYQKIIGKSKGELILDAEHTIHFEQAKPATQPPA